MKVLLIVLGVLVLIGCIPLRVRFCYHAGIELKLGVACFWLRILPQKALTPAQQEKKARKEAQKAEKKAKEKKDKQQKAQTQALTKPPAQPKPKKPLTDRIEELIPWARLGAGFVGEFFHKKLTVTRLRIRAVLSGRDPAKTAQTVGRAWEIIGIALPILERAFRIKERRLAVYPDFQADQTELEAELCIRLRVGGLVLLGVKYGCKALALYLRKKRLAKKQKTEQAASKQNNETEKVVERI